MKHTLTKSLFIAALAAGATVSMAQTNGPSGLSARLGVFLPTERLSSLGSTWFGLGLDYKLDGLRLGKPLDPETKAYVSFNLDYYNYGGNSNLPLALSYNMRSGQTVWGIGAGLDFYNIDDLSESGTAFGLQASYTYEFGNYGKNSNPLFLQAKYFLADRAELRGFGVYLGVRF